MPAAVVWLAAMVLEKEKMTSLGFLLMRVLRNQPPLKAVCRSLGCLNYEEAFFRLLESLSIQSSDLRIDSAPDKHANWGWAKCSGGGDHFSHLGSVASNGFTSCRNYRRDILVALPNMASEAISECLL